MNNTRRKQIEKLTAQIEEIKETIESLRDEEQDAFDNLPESLQGGERGEKTLEVVGKEQDLEMLMSAMFLNDEQFKALFPDYQTEKECQEWTRKQLADLKDTIARTLCRIINDGDMNNPLFDKFRSFYLNELTK